MSMHLARRVQINEIYLILQDDPLQIAFHNLVYNMFLISPPQN